MTIFLRCLDRLIGYLVAAAKWLVLPLITLLFLQWPLRDLFRGYVDGCRTEQSGPA